MRGKRYGQDDGKKEKDDEPATRPAPKADPADFGLNVPDGTPKPGDGRLVFVKSADDEVVVAKTLVEVADQLMVMLPDGRLRLVPTSEATPTVRNFEPVSMQDMAKKLFEISHSGFSQRFDGQVICQVAGTGLMK